MTPTQQLIREIVDSFIPEYSNIAVFDDDRINGYEIVPAKPFILAKLSQVLESVEGELEGEKRGPDMGCGCAYDACIGACDFSHNTAMNKAISIIRACLNK